LSAFLGVCSVA
jgi:hypothetical protein